MLAVCSRMKMSPAPLSSISRAVAPSRSSNALGAAPIVCAVTLTVPDVFISMLLLFATTMSPEEASNVTLPLPASIMLSGLPGTSRSRLAPAVRFIEVVAFIEASMSRNAPASVTEPLSVSIADDTVISRPVFVIEISPAPASSPTITPTLETLTIPEVLLFI